MEWGVGKDWTFKWHTPTQPEIRAAVHMIEHFTDVCVRELHELVAQPKQHAFSKWLTILYNVIAGINVLVGEESGWDQPEPCDEYYQPRPTLLPSGLALTDGFFNPIQVQSLSE